CCDRNAGASPPMPPMPWQPMHPFCENSSSPSLAVPRPGGSSSPVGAIEMSMRRSSASVGVRPTPYVGACAVARLPAKLVSISEIATILSGLRSSSALREPIGHAPVLRNSPRHDAVVEPGHAVVALERNIPPIRDFFAQWLPLPDVVDAARHDL